jgi:hypothetical protein
MMTLTSGVMTMNGVDEVTEFNAYAFSDNYAIVKLSTGECIGCEHNEEEALCVAAWYSAYHGLQMGVKRNGVDAVRRAGSFRVEPFRFRFRATAFKEYGLGTRHQIRVDRKFYMID